MTNLVIFAPNGFGDLVMLSSLMRNLSESHSKCAIVVKSPKHAELLDELGVSGFRYYFLDTKSKMSVLLLIVSLIFHQPVIIAPLLSSKKVPQLILSLIGKQVYLPKKCYWFRNLIEINSSFDQRGKRHLVNYFIDAFVQAKIIKDGFNIGHDYQYPVVEKFNLENSGKKRILVCLSCGVDERHKIPNPEVFAKFFNHIEYFDKLEIVCIGVKTDVPIIEQFFNNLDVRYERKSHIDLNFRELRGVMSKCEVGITGTTGQGHIASTCMDNLIVFDGVTSDAASGPIVKNKCVISHVRVCGPCYNEDFLYGCGVDCMNDLGAADNIEKFRASLDKLLRK